MKQTCLLSFFFIWFHLFLFASNDPFAGGSRALSLGGCSLTLSDPYSVLNNQAAMAFLKQTSFSLYAEQRYLQKELGYYAAGFTLPVKNGAFGLSVNYDGFDLYNEKKVGFGYARLFSQKISGSIQIDYLSTTISEYGSSTVFTAEAGLLVKLSGKLSSAAHIYNPVAVSSGFADEKIPIILSLGLSYEAGKKILLLAEAEKNINFSARFKAGAEYKIADALHLRGGVATNPAQYFMGAGINLKDLKIDFAASYHQVLGVTPAISLNYLFRKK